MNPLLAPQPMTPAQIASLVDRARAAERRKHAERARKASPFGHAARRENIAKRVGTYKPVSDVDRAVAYAYLHRASIEDASEEYGVTLRDAIVRWNQLHDGIEMPRRSRQ